MDWLCFFRSFYKSIYFQFLLLTFDFSWIGLCVFSFISFFYMGLSQSYVDSYIFFHCFFLIIIFRFIAKHIFYWEFCFVVFWVCLLCDRFRPYDHIYKFWRLTRVDFDFFIFIFWSWFIFQSHHSIFFLIRIDLCVFFSISSPWVYSNHVLVVAGLSR
jgi:hypothetical protein